MPVIIVGGGAAGLMAAISAARTLQIAGCPAGHTGQPQVMILERMDKVGRKLLATGNGRCNLSNRQAGPDCYYGRDPRFARGALHRFPVEQTLAFFAGIGLPCREEAEGRLYPYSQQAAAVLDLLRQEAGRLQVHEQTHAAVTRLIRLEPAANHSVSIPASAGRFLVETRTGARWRAGSVILAAGGQAAPALGSDGSGLLLASQLGHAIIPPFPALVQVCTSGKAAGAMSGARFLGQIQLLEVASQKILARQSGEILFTDDGVSGIPVFQVSRQAGAWLQAAAATDPGAGCAASSRVAADESAASRPAASGLQLQFDFMPDFTSSQLVEMLEARRQRQPGLPASEWLTGLVHKRIGQQLVRELPDLHPALELARLRITHSRQLAGYLKGWTLGVSSTRGWTSAQVMAGGLACSEFYPDRLESRRCPGLFAAGEILDIDGDCGGFNLQWAWSSGFVAGQQAARLVSGDILPSAGPGRQPDLTNQNPR